MQPRLSQSMHSSLGHSGWFMFACDINWSQHCESQDLFWEFGVRMCVVFDQCVWKWMWCVKLCKYFCYIVWGGENLRMKWAQGRVKSEKPSTQKKPGPWCHDAPLDQIIPEGSHVSGLGDYMKKSIFNFYLYDFELSFMSFWTKSKLI